MMYITKRFLVYGLSVFCLIIIGFGVFAGKADAQYYSSSSATNTTSDYAYYKQLCPADFTLTVYNNNQYMCYKLFGGSVLGASFPFGSSLPTNMIAGCLPGHMYSQLTGQRCDVGFYHNGSGGLYGSIRNFEVRDGDDDNPQEGDNNAEVMQVRFDVEDGDITLDKVEFNFEFTGDNDAEDLPWNTFDEVRLLSDGREIARMDTDHRNDWDEESGDTYSLIFSDLDETIRENDRADLTLEVDLNSDIDGVEMGNVSWDIFIPDDGLRAWDDSGDTVYAGDDSENVSIDIEEN